MEHILTEFLNSHYVSLNEPNNQFSFTEIGEDGEGDSYFICKNKTLIIKVKNNKLFWCEKTLKRAEGSFVVLDEQMQPISLHMIEMKSTLKKRELEKAITQLKCMYLISASIMAFLGLKMPNENFAYIAYTSLEINDISDDTTFINNKVLTGKKDDVLAMWKKEEIELYYGKTAKLIKGKRYHADNGNFNCDFGMV